MSWCSDAPEDEAISLFAGLLANPDVRLSPQFPLNTELLTTFTFRGPLDSSSLHPTLQTLHLTNPTSLRSWTPLRF
jgi:hypothetical protein